MNRYKFAADEATKIFKPLRCEQSFGRAEAKIEVLVVPDLKI
jgi:hypothetical protein